MRRDNRPLVEVSSLSCMSFIRPPPMLMHLVATNLRSSMSRTILLPMTRVPCELHEFWVLMEAGVAEVSTILFRNSLFSTTSFSYMAFISAMSVSCFSFNKVTVLVKFTTRWVRLLMDFESCDTFVGNLRQSKQGQTPGKYSSTLAMQSVCTHMAQAQHLIISLPLWWPWWRQEFVQSSPHPGPRALPLSCSERASSWASPFRLLGSTGGSLELSDASLVPVERIIYIIPPE